MAKLLEILEQGEKAVSREGNIYSTNGSAIFKNDALVGYMTMELLRRDDFEVYCPPMKSNFDLCGKTHYSMINSVGEIHTVPTKNCQLCIKRTDSFNAFPVKEDKLVEYIQKKQLLDRKMMIFSYLNGADEIKWDGECESYSIDIRKNIHSDEWHIATDKWRVIQRSDKIYFKDEKTAQDCLDLYKDDMLEVARLKKELKF